MYLSVWSWWCASSIHPYIHPYIHTYIGLCMCVCVHAMWYLWDYVGYKRVYFCVCKKYENICSCVVCEGFRGDVEGC